MRKIRKTFLYLLMIAILTIQVYPIFWIFMTSLKTTEEVQKGSTFALPAAFNIHNYIRAVETSNLGLYFKTALSYYWLQLLLWSFFLPPLPLPWRKCVSV